MPVTTRELPDAETPATTDDPGTSIDIEPMVVPPPDARAETLVLSTLVIGENVRKDFDPADHPDQVARIRAHGVRAPIIAEREPDGTIVVTDGQVRAIIAQHVGQLTAPGWVTDAPTDIDPDVRRRERVLNQLEFNDGRIPLRDSDRAGGIALALDLGASFERVQESVPAAKTRLRALGAIGRSETARPMLDDSQYSLDQLAVIAEFDALGDEDAVARLTRVNRWDFDYLVARIRRERAQHAARMQASLPYGVFGFGILTRDPAEDTGGEPAFLPDTQLVEATGDPVTEDTIRADATRWTVWLDRVENGILVDTETGAPVDPDTIDHDLADDPDASPAEGKRHPSSVEYRDRWIPRYYLPAESLADSGLAVATTTAAADASDGDGDDDDQLARLADAERERRTAASRDLRRVRILNVRGEAAADRRVSFLDEYLRRRTPPPQAAGFVAEHLARKSDAATRMLLDDMLGTGSSVDDLVTTIHAAPPNRQWVIAFAIILADYHTGTSKSLWRDADANTVRMLRVLAEIGGEKYHLADVEQAAVGDLDYRDIDLD
ncbi:ParB/Srx family N-terminal domain-containing protein [Nocardia puris]|uniref:ParB/Srx family N-terminal domain-containing protein n=1 Tax=Nocardia puris TaxID=208602 RepID=UPI002E20C42C